MKDFLERVPLISIHPDAASRHDIAQLASELMEARHLIWMVWNHMNGRNVDGSRRKFTDDAACAVNWNKLSDAIGQYLEEPKE